MSAQPADHKPSLLERVPAWLPVMAAICALAGWQASAETRIARHDNTLSRFEQAYVDRTDQVARIEERVTALQDGQRSVVASLGRIEQGLFARDVTASIRGYAPQPPLEPRP